MDINPPQLGEAVSKFEVKLLKNPLPMPQQHYQYANNQRILVNSDSLPVKIQHLYASLQNFFTVTGSGMAKVDYVSPIAAGKEKYWHAGCVVMKCMSKVDTNSQSFAYSWIAEKGYTRR